MRRTHSARFPTGLGRRLAIGCLAVVLCLFGAEAAVHSVHHLDEPEPVTTCAGFAASLGTEGTCPAPAVVVTPVDSAEPDVLLVPEPFRPLRAACVPGGRAPPARPSA